MFELPPLRQPPIHPYPGGWYSPDPRRCIGSWRMVELRFEESLSRGRARQLSAYLEGRDYDFRPEFLFRDGISTMEEGWRYPLLSPAELDAILCAFGVVARGYFLPTAWGWTVSELEAADYYPRVGDSMNTMVPVRPRPGDLHLWGVEHGRGRDGAEGCVERLARGGRPRWRCAHGGGVGVLARVPGARHRAR